MIPSRLTRRSILRKPSRAAAVFFVCLSALVDSSPASRGGRSVEVFSELVVSDDSVASSIGAEILSQGGNAVDAAIAMAFALAVTYPQAGNIGGGGFMLVRLSSGETSFIDYREKAPLRAGRDMYLDSDGRVIKGASTRGHLAVGVPGSVAGMLLAHHLYGTVPWSDLLEPAQGLARDGFPVGKGLVSAIESHRQLLESSEESKRIFLRPRLKVGDLWVQEDLAETLGRIMKDGESDFYRGKTARLIAEEMVRNGGLITLEDLSSYRAVLREPIRASYRGFEILSAPLPSSGGIILSELLQIVEPFDISGLGFHSKEAVHLLSEAEKVVYRVRALYLGDSDFYPVPWRELLGSSYIEKLRRLIDPSSVLSVGALESTDTSPLPAAGDGKRSKGTPEGRSGIRSPGDWEETTHFSIVDRWGNAVSNTYTLNSSFGSGVTVAGAGFLLNNEMDDFSIKPGHPNLYGLVGDEANAIEPGKRMLSSMSPTIVLRGGRLFMVLGTPGGSTIPTTVFQVLTNVVDYGMTLEEAVSAPRFHEQYLPDAIFTEAGALSGEVRESLENLGHRFIERPPIGDVQAILVSGGRLFGVSDPRGRGRATGR